MHLLAILVLGHACLVWDNVAVTYNYIKWNNVLAEKLRQYHREACVMS